MDFIYLSACYYFLIDTVFFMILGLIFMIPDCQVTLILFTAVSVLLCGRRSEPDKEIIMQIVLRNHFFTIF